MTGAAQSDGTAGAIYYTLPVAIDALQDGGVHQQFAGCYTTKLVDPDNEDPPVTPMYIFKASLHVAHGAIASLLPHCRRQLARARLGGAMTATGKPQIQFT